MFNRLAILTEVEADLKKLYRSFDTGELKREDAAEFSNIAGKRLKGVQLHIADEFLRRAAGKALPAPRTIKGRDTLDDSE